LIAYAGSRWNKNINRSYAYLGQGPDITAIAEHVEKYISPDTPITLFGCCRGGSAALNYVAEFNPKNLKAIVLEAVPASMPWAMHAFLAKCGIPMSYDERFLKMMFPAYPAASIPPIDALQNIQNKKLPILILHSKIDKNIPFVHALKLYKAFKDNGFENVHLVSFEGQHAYLLRDAREKYLTAVHSFYKQYGLAHKAEYATKDMSFYAYDMQESQREIEAYEQGLKHQTKKTQKTLTRTGVLALGGLVSAYVYYTAPKIMKRLKSKKLKNKSTKVA
jgi:dienelactone hydrolase